MTGVGVTKIWSTYDVLLADLDGVVYEGKNAIEFAVEVISQLKRSGIPVGYVTNNSSRKPETIAEQLLSFGLETNPDDIIGSALTGAQLLESLVPAGSKVLVVGGEGLRSRVSQFGFQVVDSADDTPAAVIQGFAPDVAWRNLAEAAYAIQRGAIWVATNSDWTIPQDRGLAPGNGTLISAVHTAVGQLPVVAGKPEPAIYKTAIDHFGAKKPLFVGDRLDTDITGANRAGIDSALVLTGVCTRKEILAAKPEARPTYIIENLLDLTKGYQFPKATKRGFRCGEAEVELLGTKVLVTLGDPKSVDALKAASALIWNSSTPIYGLDVEAALYE
ncbi:MAG: hypothetical protein RIR16_910 [Actinomycetota bacterium]